MTLFGEALPGQLIEMLPGTIVSVAAGEGMDFAFSMRLQMAGMQVLIACWIFILGTCFGSFLNVVIYRLPAGMSLGRPKSRCPRCETPLAARDNIPILGWLLLRGRCRYCRLPIAARYPVIEFVCGSVFLLLLFGELLTGAANLPVRVPDHFHVRSGFWLVWFTKWDLSGLYLFHCCMLIIVLAISMIGYDGHPPVRKLTWFGILTAVLLGTMWPELRAAAAFDYPTTIRNLSWGFHWTDHVITPGARYWTGMTVAGLCDGIAGVAGGALVAGLIGLQMSSGGPADRHSTAAEAISHSFLIVGAFLGWQAAGMLAVIVLPALAVARLAAGIGGGRQVLRFCAPTYFVILTAFLLTWRRADESRWMIGMSGWTFTRFNWWQDWLITFAILLLLALLVRFAGPSGVSESEDQQVGREVSTNVSS